VQSVKSVVTFVFFVPSWLLFSSPPPRHQDTKSRLYFSTLVFLCDFVAIFFSAALKNLGLKAD
jgi:hypothetical protein